MNKRVETRVRDKNIKLVGVAVIFLSLVHWRFITRILKIKFF